MATAVEEVSSEKRYNKPITAIAAINTCSGFNISKHFQITADPFNSFRLYAELERIFSEVKHTYVQ